MERILTFVSRDRAFLRALEAELERMRLFLRLGDPVPRVRQG